MPQEITRLADPMLTQSCARRRDAAGFDGRPHRPARHPHRKIGQAVFAGRRPQDRKDRSRAGLHPHQAWRRQSRALACRRPGFGAEAIHGNKSQNQRERVLADFRSGRLRILIATDIAARGIDVDGVSHVINYDLPNIPESYVHRIGRTARAGADGVAISFCDQEEGAFLRDIERMIRITIPATGERQPHKPAQRNAGNRQGNRPHRNGGHQQRGHNGGRQWPPPWQ